MDKYDTSQLTEFPRFEPESSQSGVSTFFNKLLKFPLFTPSENAEGSQIKNNDDENKSTQNAEGPSRRVSEAKTEVGSYAAELEGRSLPNVLRRISSLIALGSGGGTRYADTELARYWMPDDISRECYECAARFSTLRRRHHCRVCGQIFCNRCCSQRVPGHIFGCAGGLRVCNYCCNVVLSYLKENDLNGEISPDLKTLQENLQVKFPDNKGKTSLSRDNFVFARDQEERNDSRNSSTEAVHEIFVQMSYALPTQQHRYRLIRYSGVWRGADILQWVIDNTNNKTRIQANLICQNLLSSGYLECVTEVSHFADYALYRPITLQREADDNVTNVNKTVEPCEESSLLAESVSSYCLDLNLDENSARLIKTPKTDVEESKTPVTEESPVIEHIEDDSECKPVCKGIVDWGAEHLRQLTRQCLARAALSDSWLEILLPLCEQAADIIMPDLDSNDIDVRNYVQVKKVPGGAPRDSCLINGVVLTKNVAHRGMPQQISNPTILLLDCSIAYQRVEGKLTSLEPMLLQECEYLARSWLRLSSLGAGVVLARGGAGRAVVGAARGAGIALALRVPREALLRAARATRADLLASLDARVGVPALGTAQNFYVKNYGSKTLMVLEGCANPHLNCCILLRGASLQELVRVKRVVKFMVLACYNWKLEKAFYADIEAVIPEPGMTFDDEDDTEAQNDFFKNIDEKSDSLLNENSKETEVEKNTVEDSTEQDKLKVDAEEDLDTETKTPVKDDADKQIEDNELSKEETHKSSECSEDPLQKPKYSRKTENLSCGVPIRDFSDPLRATMSVDDEVFLPKEETTLVADTQSERWCAEGMSLCMSPGVVCAPPYLESDAGARAAVRRLYPRPLLPPPAHTHAHAHRTHADITAPKRDTVQREVHPFVRMAMTAPADDLSVRTALASYRAVGNTIHKSEHKRTCPQYKPSIVSTKEKEDDKKDKQEEPLDPYAPENHQKLHLLLYSYSHKSANVPDFCVNPWVMTMDAYGRHDISLGAFLDKYCFNSQLACSSTNCQVPVNQHVRKFVHGDVCITITCNTIGHSNVDKIKEEQNKQISVWWRCEQCGVCGRGRRLSGRARRLSLAVYVRWRCAGARRPLRAPLCAHAPHTHTHAFQRGLTTAAFRYSKISFHDIVLPPDVITTIYDTKQMRDALITQLNELMLKGHETFAALSGETEREQQQFKHHMEGLHVAVSAPALREAATDAVIRSLWSISDGIIFGEKMLREVQDKWSSPPAKPKQSQENSADEKSDLEDAAVEDNTGTTYVFGSDSNKDADKEHAGQDEDEERGDKKTIRQILSQLLSSNQSTDQAGMLACGGLVPVVVLAHQTGSAIAAALAAPQTRRHAKHKHTSVPEQEEVDANSTNKDKTDGDKSKTTKSNEHVEVLLKDGLVCRVYYAAQFEALRHAVIAPLASDEECCCDDKKLCSIEEGFIRSLAHCVPWATRGGKSGSTFFKTKDDRYVLKEMTKPEWQQFLEFAPHYFNYVMTCRQNKTPSVLARMLGVYSVWCGGGGGAGGAGLLVLENVWYRAPPARYDLKGASRHRLAPHQPPPEHAHAHHVLMDENLLNLRWERALFVRSACARALWACLERDTRFLAAHHVMDYSLLLAHDATTLVLGIVDYIRTFTWDKKLEHLVKKNLGSGQPTVVSPDQYKGRFCTAARKYFLHCPEHWDHLYDLIS